MTGLDLAHDLALLGAAAGAAPAAGGAGAAPGAWEDLGRRMAAHLDIPDATQDGLCQGLGLSPTAYWLVMLCGCVELFPDAAAAMGQIADERRLRLPTPLVFAQLLHRALGLPLTRVLGEATGHAAAARLGLVEFVDGGDFGRPRTQQPLRLTGAALASLLGGSSVALAQSPSLSVHREEPAGGCGLPAPTIDVAAGVLAERGLLCIRSASPRSGRQLALDVATRRGEHALLVTASDVLPGAAELGRLRGALPVLDLSGWCRTQPFPEPYVRAVGELLPQLVAVLPHSAATGDLPAVDVDHISWADSRRIWTLALDDVGAGASLGGQLRVSLEEARHAVRAARELARVRAGVPGTVDEAAIAAQVLAQGARRMEQLATRLPTGASLDGLAVPAAVRQQLDEVVAWQRTCPEVYEAWGMAEHVPAARHLPCLLSGVPGCGKTLAAQGIAAALRLNLYRVDLDDLRRGREAHVGRLIEAAEGGHGVLLFDDVEALWQSSRGEALEALLQRLEAFAGVALFTADSRVPVPPQVLRRFRMVVEMPLPDRAARQRIWDQVLPAAPHRGADVDTGLLAAALPVSGGMIQAIGLGAAHLAAAAPAAAVGLLQLAQSARRELRKAHLPHGREDLGPLGPYAD